MRQATNAKAAKPASSPPNHANPYGLNNKWTGSAKNSAGDSSRWYNLAPTNPARHGKEIRASASPEFLAAIPRRARTGEARKAFRLTGLAPRGNQKERASVQSCRMQSKRDRSRTTLQSPSRVEGYKMTTTSQRFPASQEEFTLIATLRGSPILKFAAALAFIGALALALAPSPAFAQHGGGGGGGGGSHGGGGGGGGSHGSFGGGGSASAPSGGGESHASGGSAGSSNTAHNSGSSGHWWNPFHSGSATAMPAKGANGVPAGNIKSESSATSERFAAGNNTWQEPPTASARAAARVNYYGPANVNGSRPFVPLTATTRAPITSAHGVAAVAAAE